MLRPSPPSVPILMYHSVSRQAARRFRAFAISPELFAEQMEYLAQQGYTPLTVTQLVRARQAPASSLPERAAVITFDDGFSDFYSEVLPILRQYKFAATLYVTTAYIGRTSGWLKREGEAARGMLGWEQLREICASGIECGGHSHTHAQLDVLPEPLARAEIAQNKKILEDNLHQGVHSFAYPFGYYSETTRRLVEKAGYSSACAVKYASSPAADDVFALSRLFVKADASMDDFRALLAYRESPAWAALKQARALAWRGARQSAARLQMIAGQEGNGKTR